MLASPIILFHKQYYHEEKIIHLLCGSQIWRPTQLKDIKPVESARCATKFILKAVASPGGFQGFLETSQTPAIVYSTIQLASYSLGATGSELSL